ncbi:MAG TPA: hypothetical protein VFJ86_13385 [Usitatibacter sp.]|jgi:hypothetical protein|nr:hypothetical protein [Usitatibacter sp.]
MLTITARNDQEISTILDYVHDRQYKIEDIQYDAQSRTLRIPIEIEIPTPRSVLGIKFNGKSSGLGTLIIRSADDWKVVEDRSEIGYGDINRILCRPGALFIEGSLPVNLEVKVATIDLEFSAPDNVLPA